MDTLRRMKTEAPGSSERWSLVALDGEEQSGVGAWKQQSQRKEDEEKDLSFDFSPQETKIEAAATRGDVKRWAWSACGRRDCG
jgi:hypothetical protein